MSATSTRNLAPLQLPQRQEQWHDLLREADHFHQPYKSAAFPCLRNTVYPASSCWEACLSSPRAEWSASLAEAVCCDPCPDMLQDSLDGSRGLGVTLVCARGDVLDVGETPPPQGRGTDLGLALTWTRDRGLS